MVLARRGIGGWRTASAGRASLSRVIHCLRGGEQKKQHVLFFQTPEFCSLSVGLQVTEKVLLVRAAEKCRKDDILRAVDDDAIEKMTQPIRKEGERFPEGCELAFCKWSHAKNVKGMVYREALNILALNSDAGFEAEEMMANHSDAQHDSDEDILENLLRVAEDGDAAEFDCLNPKLRAVSAPYSTLSKVRAECICGGQLSLLVEEMKKSRPKSQAEKADVVASILVENHVPVLNQWLDKARGAKEKESIGTILKCVRCIIALASPRPGFGGSALADVNMVMGSLKSSTKASAMSVVADAISKGYALPPTV